MPLSSAAKAALCLCPPAVMAGAVATVPAAKRAVHHLTAPHHATRPVHRIATAASRPAAEPVAAGCNPVAPGPLPAVPLVTYAAPIPPEPGVGPAGGPGQNVPGGASGILAPQAPVAPVGGVGLTPPGSTAGGTAPGLPATPVPEPASWLMMIVGAGTLGAMLRRRRLAARAGRPVAVGAALWAGSAADAGEVAATAAMQSGAAKSTLATVAGKAMMCVCPAVVAAGSVVAVPPLRHAVHAATAPALAPAPPLRTPPCDPATIPVSAAAVKDYPATVTTTLHPS
jgi:hypothetical protein